MIVMDFKQANERLKRENQELRQALEVAMREIEKLKAQLGQNSQNSHWPSSRDKGKKPQRTRSLRKKSDKKAGGQKGHKGYTLEFKDNVDEVVAHRPTSCQHCQHHLASDAETTQINKRQVHDLPPLEIVVTQHEAETVLCPQCGGETAGKFPKEVTNPVQYGQRVKQLALYMKQMQLIPYARSHQFFEDVFRVSLSPGTLQNIIRKGAEAVKPIQSKLKEALKEAKVIHVDESGFYVAGERYWLHTTSTSDLTYYHVHKNRGRLALNDIDILLNFSGTAVHDNWVSYWGYDCDHGLCNVHHLRELKAVEKNDGQMWANRFAFFLLAVKAQVDDAKMKGQNCLSKETLDKIERLYAQLVDLALHANAPPPEGWPTGKRGKPKKTKARNLAERFERRRNEILRFAYDFDVPFDNNLAERDIRMLKVQQKISGCFRSMQGAEDFCAIRGYISTMQKQGLSVWNALGSLFSDHPLWPQLTPV